MNTNGMFMRIDYDPDVVDHIPEPQYWAFPDEWFYPGVDFINELPELVIIKENLEECLPLRVFYGIETESEDDSISEEVILCAFSTEEDDNEYLQYVCTRFGTYTMLYFKEDSSGQLYEVDPIILTDELKEILWLRPCEIDTDEEQHCYATYVGSSPTAQFPPLKPNAYLYGSEAWKMAVEYWNEHEDGPDPEDEEPYIDEEHGIVMFTSQEAAMNYVNNVVAAAVDEGEVPPVVACVDQPTFHDYVIRIT